MTSFSHVDVSAQDFHGRQHFGPSQRQNRSRKALEDTWAVSGVNGVWIRSHHGIRRTLETPCKIVGGPEEANHLSSLRLTCGTFDNGVKFSHIDSWKNRGDSHGELKRPWNGISAFLDFGCTDVDGCVAKL